MITLPSRPSLFVALSSAALCGSAATAVAQPVPAPPMTAAPGTTVAVPPAAPPAATSATPAAPVPSPALLPLGLPPPVFPSGAPLAPVNPGNPTPPVGPGGAVYPATIRDGEGPSAGFWQPGDPVPRGYRVRHEYRNTMLLGGGATLALSFTATTLVASGIAAVGFPQATFAALGSIPLVGPFPLAAFSSLAGGGPGTAAVLVGLGVAQTAGFAILIRGLVTRKPVGLEPRCDEGRLELSPYAAPGAAGLTMTGTL